MYIDFLPAGWPPLILESNWISIISTQLGTNSWDRNQLLGHLLVRQMALRTLVRDPMKGVKLFSIVMAVYTCGVL